MVDNNEINLQGVRVSARAGRNDIQLALEIQTPRDQVSEAGAQGIFLRPDQNELNPTLQAVQNLQTEYNRNGGPAQAREEINVHAGAEGNRRIQNGGEICFKNTLFNLSVLPCSFIVSDMELS